ncbi:two-component sensor histidine kinase [Paenibacillus pasadenensis]|uniref:Two-component sensor histidine kinase n=1 Tax=Paenibacillus pasadenensis TaxID=217090 RepID=A0A2N5N7Z6_9BACL|nr:sensor histidine kinase [Paenibacillus pasadenensis]PLT46467.1 two-component sensor histidine kinase [Paenibacillus pasadenensis]
MRRYLWRIFDIRSSIQSKFFISFFLITLLALGSITWIWYANSTALLKRNASQYRMDNIKDANHRLDLMMTDYVSLTTLVSMNKENVIGMIGPRPAQSEYERFMSRQQVERFLASIYTFSSGIMAIEVTDGSGEVFSAGDVKPYYRHLEEIMMPDVKASAGKAAFLRVSLEDGLDTYSEETHLIVMGQSIYKGGGHAGAVFLYLRYSAVSSLFETERPSGTQELVIDDEGNIIYASSSEMGRQDGQLRKYGEAIGRIRRNGGEAAFQDGDKLVLLYRSNDTQWTTVGFIPIDMLIHDSRVLRDRMLVMLGAVLLALIGLSALLSRQTSRHIIRLSRAMKSVEDGELKVPALPRTSDEIGLLARRFSSMMLRIQQLLEETKEKERRKREVDLKALQSQIHPHFLYNTLNTIRYMAKLQHAANIEEVTGSLIELLRSSIGRGKEQVTLSEEMAAVAHYVAIQRYKFVEDFEVSCDIDAELLECLVFPLMVQPLVENALLHGLMGLQGDGGGVIAITARLQEDDTFLLEVSDNGPGMAASKLEELLGHARGPDEQKMFGIGLCNVHERIRLAYGEPFGLHIRSAPGAGMAAQLHLPVRKAAAVESEGGLRHA